MVSVSHGEGLYISIIVSSSSNTLSFIGLINKDYFTPLFTSTLGVILVIIMLVIYITYIIPDSELKTLKNLGINVINEPNFYSENTFIY